MKFKILIDSLSCFNTDELNSENVEVVSVPLVLRVNNIDYVDNGENHDDVIQTVYEDKKCLLPTSTSCPSPQDYLNHYTGADYYIVITVGQKVSGSYNSACIAKDMTEHPENIYVVDSMTACGAEELLAHKAVELINSGKSFADVVSGVSQAVKDVNILFSLGSFTSLIRMGRVSKIVASVAQLLRIKPLGIAKDGEIHILEKAPRFSPIEKRFVVNIAKLLPETKGRVCIINYTIDDAPALSMKKIIEENFHFDKVIVRKNMLVSAYYTLPGTIMVSF